MAAMFSALNAKIRANPMLSYVCSTHFWGPVSNFGIPIAAVMDTKKSPEFISGKMTACLCVYSATFMRYSMAVTPANYLLFACHFVNEGAQLMQGYRFLNYWNFGGREQIEAARQKASEGISKVEEKASEAKSKIQSTAEKMRDQAAK